MPVAAAAAVTAVSTCRSIILRWPLGYRTGLRGFERHASTSRKPRASKGKIVQEVLGGEAAREIPAKASSSLRKTRPLTAKNVSATATEGDTAALKDSSPSKKSRRAKAEPLPAASEEPEVEVAETPKDNTPTPRPQQVLWASLSKQKTLGVQSPILVLRDTERKRGSSKHGEQAVEEGMDERLDVDGILASIKNQKLDPAQQDVNQSIESMRPARVMEHMNKIPCITTSTYKSLITSLRDGFNQIQLASYIATQDVCLHARSSDVPENLLPANITYASPWKRHNESNLRVPRRSRGRKEALADRVIRSTWQLEVIEELGSTGILRLKLDSNLLSLIIFGGNTSPLKHIAAARKVTIDSNPREGTVEIIGDRLSCTDVVDDIGRLLRDLVSAELDLFPFNRKLSTEDLTKFGERFRCAVEIKKSGDKVMIRGRRKQDLELCQRMLVNTFAKPPSPSKDLVLIGGKELPAHGLLCGIPKGMKALPYLYERSHLGRYAVTHRVSKDSKAPTKLHVPTSTFDLATFEQICEHLDHSFSSIPSHMSHSEPARIDEALAEKPSSPSWQPRSQTELWAETGQLLHKIQGQSIVQSIDSKTLLGQDLQRRTFVQSASGLPEFLFKELSLSPNKQWTLMRVPLVVSPWDPLATSDSCRVPDLELILSVEPVSRAIKADSLTAVLKHHTASVMLPSLASDVRFSRREVLGLEHPEADATIKAFVREIHDTIVGYGSVRPPLFLNVSLPKWTLGVAHDQGVTANGLPGGGMVEIQYFATGIEYDESRSYEYKGQELVIHRVRGGEFGASFEGLTLRCLPSADRPTSAQPRMTGENEKGLGDEPVSLTEDESDRDTARQPARGIKTSQLVDLVSDMLRALNRGVGRFPSEAVKVIQSGDRSLNR